MDLLLGLDVGTTAVKGIAYDVNGGKHAFASHQVELFKPRARWVEQNAEGLWQAVVAVCRKIGQQLPSGKRVYALSVSTQGGTTIPVDSLGQPTCNAFSWMDERASDEAEAAAQALSAGWIYATTGWPLYAGQPLNHIAWFHKNYPDRSARTRRFMFVNDYILWKFSAELCMDPSNAGITQLYNLALNEWDERLLEQAGVLLNQLSPIRASGTKIGTLTEEAASATGLDAGIEVINGAHDQYCAALGTGVIQPGDVLLSCGTAWVVLVVPTSSRQAFQGGLCVSKHPVHELWGGIRSMGGVGASVEWLMDQFWPNLTEAESRYQVFNQAVMSSTPGSRGLVFTPLSGGHIEAGEADNRGLLGLGLNHTRGDIARAVLEGITMELCWMLDDIQHDTPVHRLKMIGGAARSPIWPQIVADLTRIPVILPSETEAASLGAAILAGVGAGWYPDAVNAYAHFSIPESEVRPDPSTLEWSRQVNHRYRSLWECLPHHAENKFEGIS